MNDRHTIQAPRLLLATAANLHASASKGSVKEFKRSLHEWVSSAAASSPATPDERQVMEAAWQEIARLPE
jgi:hypothetical protein